jgi:hypothetical protein
MTSSIRMSRLPQEASSKARRFGFQREVSGELGKAERTERIVGIRPWAGMKGVYTKIGLLTPLTSMGAL